MKSRLAPRIRKELAGTDGLTVAEISLLINCRPESVRPALAAMPDAYVDRWVRREGMSGVPYESIWMVVDVPEDCPRPEHKSKRRKESRCS